MSDYSARFAADQALLSRDVSDEELERAAGRDQEASSLWSSIDVSGCTCWKPGMD
jgi:hypothetical protein